MKPLKVAWRLLAIVGLLAASLASSPKSPYSRQEKAFYADQGLVDFVRPGLKITINSAAIAADGTISVIYTLTDPQGAPLDIAGVTTPGKITLAYVAAYIPRGQEQYVAYTTAQAKGDKLGTITRPNFELFAGQPTPLGPGQYQYTLKAKAPAGFDTGVTTTVAVDGNRDLTEFKLGANYAGATYSFVPDGTAVKVTRDVVRTQSCNSCHDNLAFHGGYAHGMDMCVLCHQPQNADPATGNSLDLKVMAHKIHMGSQLPSVVAGTPYQIVGYMNSLNDFSNVTDPADPRRCEVCHSQATGATQAKEFMTDPTRAACGSCHDDVNFATGVNHPGGPQFDDNLCSTCHIAQGEMPFDASIKGAHVVPTDTALTYPQNPDTLLSGLTAKITKVDNGVAGKAPTVSFTVQDSSGHGVPLAKLSSISITMTGPTSDYGTTSFGSDVTTPGYVTESATKSATCDAGGNCTYTFTHSVPANATGTFAVGIEARRSETVLAGTTAQKTVQYGAANPVMYFSVDGTSVTPRRTVVAETNCNQCHVALSLHGTLRNNPEYCVFCHNPSNTDVSMRPLAKVASDKTAPPQGINFSLLVHRIHDGVNVTANGGKPYIVVGYGGSHNDFSDVLFPAMSPEGSATYLQNCSLCHANGSEQNLPIGLNPVTDPQGWMNPTQATAAACSGCHVSKAEASHFLANTTSQLGEACSVCHDGNSQFSVDSVHAH
ncbi:MAG TPA: OmcA/MtrC family decaheme c-type cytochrome [Bryobacteraceae bacterium]|nr:OmcA/MtrC family decaheme c-type cytochrome [Bryobacteraceae bacterium]